jgi:hypothetical protein
MKISALQERRKQPVSVISQVIKPNLRCETSFLTFDKLIYAL